MLMLLAYEYLRNKKYVRFTLVALLASLFHTSALVGFTILIFEKISEKPTLIRKVGIVLIVPVVASITPIYNFLMRSNIFTKLGNYVLTKNVPISEMFFFALKGLLFEIPLIVIFLFLLLNNKREIVGWDYTLLAMIVIECGFWGVGSINPVFMRLSYYYQLAFFWIIPRIMEILNTKEKTGILKLGIIGFIFVRMFLFYFIWCYDGIIPYSFA